ncbi:MAG: hypothetical protein KGN16_20100 [Burkholderiales bacterium]|nr:hypothetical protein [Burkholderiales bacterium]
MSDKTIIEVADQVFTKALTDAVPDWIAIGNSHPFSDWELHTDPRTGVTYRAELNHGFEVHDVAATIAVYKRFKDSLQGVIPSPEPNDWTGVAKDEDVEYAARDSTFKYIVLASHARAATVLFKQTSTQSHSRNLTSELSVGYVTTKDCAQGYGALGQLSMDAGVTIRSDSYAANDGSVYSKMADHICALVNKKTLVKEGANRSETH